MDSERTTGDLLVELDSDYRRCYEMIIQRLDEGISHNDGSVSAEYEFEARQFIRATFAYIEGATFILKIEAHFKAKENGVELLPQQIHFIFESDFILTDNGEVQVKPTKIALSKNIRFAFNIFAEATKLDYMFDSSVEWWSCFKQATRTRDRLTHPRMPGDLDVEPREVIAAIKAKSGFDEVLHSLLLDREV